MKGIPASLARRERWHLRFLPWRKASASCPLVTSLTVYVLHGSEFQTLGAGRLAGPDRARISMDNDECHPLSVNLAQRVGTNADAAYIAAVVVSMLQEMDAVLSPIIGSGGVSALYERALHLTSSADPRLFERRDATQARVDFATLSSLLAPQSPDVALATGKSLLRTFYGLLANLVGESLTEQLLASVWANPLNSASPRDQPL